MIKAIVTKASLAVFDDILGCHELGQPRCSNTETIVQTLRNHAGQPDYMTDEQAKVWFHLFTSAVYFTPLLGGLLSDIFLGKYRTIILLSIVYCLGHFMLAIDDTRFGLGIGLALISVGAGGIGSKLAAGIMKEGISQLKSGFGL